MLLFYMLFFVCILLQAVRALLVILLLSDCYFVNFRASVSLVFNKQNCLLIYASVPRYGMQTYNHLTVSECTVEDSFKKSPFHEFGDAAIDDHAGVQDHQHLRLVSASEADIRNNQGKILLVAAHREDDSDVSETEEQGEPD